MSFLFYVTPILHVAYSFAKWGFVLKKNLETSLCVASKLLKFWGVGGGGGRTQFW